MLFLILPISKHVQFLFNQTGLNFQQKFFQRQSVTQVVAKRLEKKILFFLLSSKVLKIIKMQPAAGL